MTGSKKPENPLHTRLDALALWWLDISCGQCKASSTPPLNMLARQHGGGLLLKYLLPRFRCRYCKALPGSIFLQETPHRSNEGMASGSIGWRIDLLRPGSERTI